jgi:hypothetical protein
LDHPDFPSFPSAAEYPQPEKVHSDPGFGFGFHAGLRFKTLQIALPVPVVEETRPAIVATLHQILGNAGKIGTG